MSNKLVEELKNISGDDESQASTKYKKAASSSHNNNRSIERSEENARPRLSFETLRNHESRILPDPYKCNPDPSCKYAWFAMDQQGKAGYSHATTVLGYSPVSVAEMPEMAQYVHGDQLDPSIRQDKIYIREMILCKIHVEDWTTRMTYYHHAKPAEEEAGIKGRFHDQVKNRGNGIAILKGIKHSF